MRKTKGAWVDNEDNDYARCDGTPKEPLLSELMKCIVYDEWVMGPVRYAIREISRFCMEEKTDEAIRLAAALGRSNHEITPDQIGELDPPMSKMVVRHVLPDLKWDISPLEPLIKKLWHVVTKEMNPAHYVSVEPWIYRFYEHQGRYREARQIQRRFIEFYRKQGDRGREAGTVNNFAYEYQLEGRFGEAAALFEKAAKIHQETGNKEDYANSRANYWICRFELDAVDGRDMAQLEVELKGIDQAIGRSGGWYRRKPLILQARIEEREGNLGNAIRLAKQAIESTLGQGSRYHEIDSAYLDYLLKKEQEKMGRLAAISDGGGQT